MFYGASYEKFMPLPDNSQLGHERRYIAKEMATALKQALEEYDPTVFLKFTIEYGVWDNAKYRIYNEILDMYTSPYEWRQAVENAPGLAPELRRNTFAFLILNKKRDLNTRQNSLSPLH